MRTSSPCSLGLSATSQQYFSLRTNQPPAISQQYFSLRANQHQPSATSQMNRLLASWSQDFDDVIVILSFISTSLASIFLHISHSSQQPIVGSTGF
jgi:hypothetical protein